MYFIINKAFWKLNLCFMILTVLKNTSYYHLVAAFIPKVFCSVQRWTHFTYFVANSWILITHRVWSPLKGYKPTQRHLDLINIHKPLYQFSNFPGGGAPSKTTDFSAWPQPSGVTLQRPVRVGVSVESEKDGCGTKGEVYQSEIRCFRIDRLRRRTKRKTALACVSIFCLGFNGRIALCGLVTVRFPLGSRAQRTASNPIWPVASALCVRLTVKLHTDETRNITGSGRQYA